MLKMSFPNDTEKKKRGGGIVESKFHKLRCSKEPSRQNK